MNTTRIIKKINKFEFKRLINESKNNINISHHSLFHLNEAQRKIYNKNYLKNILLKEKIYFVGLQKMKDMLYFIEEKIIF